MTSKRDPFPPEWSTTLADSGAGSITSDDGSWIAVPGHLRPSDAVLAVVRSGWNLRDLFDGLPAATILSGWRQGWVYHDIARSVDSEPAWTECGELHRYAELATIWGRP